MLVLDTNLVSELMRPRPAPRVLDWVAAQPLSEMAIAAITVMEIREPRGIMVGVPGLGCAEDQVRG